MCLEAGSDLVVHDALCLPASKRKNDLKFFRVLFAAFELQRLLFTTATSLTAAAELLPCDWPIFVFGYLYFTSS